MLLDMFIDELIRLQSDYSNLIWRLWEEDGVNIEFYLEELAIDCSKILRIANIQANYQTRIPRVVHVPLSDIEKDMHAVLHAVKMFLEQKTNIDTLQKSHLSISRGINDETDT